MLKGWATEINDITSLIFLADISFLVCKKIYDKFSIPETYPAKSQFFIFSANSAFMQSISVLHSLLEPLQEEINCKLLLKNIIDEEKPWTESITVSIDKVKQFETALRKDYPNPNYYKYNFLTKNDNRQIGNIIQEIKMIKRKDGLKDFERIKAKFKRYDFHIL